jgi:two-component system, NtrC family, response regulator GlrR
MDVSPSDAMPLPDFVRFNLIGESPTFCRTLAVVPRIAECDATVLVQGETGTGKELVARAVHYLSSRREFPFIPVNCGAIPDALFENELFGHDRGAYTDAGMPQIGLVAEAAKGTLFLDEVESLSLRAQVALLRFLQDGTYRRLGGRGDLHANVRIIAASNAALDELCDRGVFRRDLLYRLMVMSVTMPALRERAGDVHLLAAHFIHRFSQQYRRAAVTLDPAFGRYLISHTWPGNVRELENLVHRQFLLSDDGLMRLPETIDAVAPATIEAAPAASHDFLLGFSAAKTRAIVAFERSFVSWALSENHGNVSRAARTAGKERRSFARLMKKYGFTRTEFAR